MSEYLCLELALLSLHCRGLRASSTSDQQNPLFMATQSLHFEAQTHT